MTTDEWVLQEFMKKGLGCHQAISVPVDSLQLLLNERERLVAACEVMRDAISCCCLVSTYCENCEDGKKTLAEADKILGGGE